MINIRETEEQKIYISSDFHLGHLKDFVWKDRGFTDVKSHDDGVIDSVNSVVRPNDILWFLGDWCLNTTIEAFEAYLARINCQNIYFVWGNHNNPHEKRIYQEEVRRINKICQITSYTGSLELEIYPLRYKNMVFFPHYVEAILGGQYVTMMHYPISIWNEMKHGAWMLCGHSHYNFPQTQAENTYGKILDVGWDGHGKPWSLAEIADVMNNKRFQPMGDHHQ